MTLSEDEILELLDLAFYGIPNNYFPVIPYQEGHTKFNFFLDLEHGHCDTAGNRIHLYADATRWAVVFEKSGYESRGPRAGIELDYVGNCIDYPIDRYPEEVCISNSSNIILIDADELERIENRAGEEMENYELIAHNIEEIKVRDQLISFDNDYKNYEKIGIEVRDYGNPKKLIGFPDFLRYLHETNPTSISATEDDIRKHIPKDVPKLMTIDEFHFSSIYDDTNPPSKQETYQLIAKVLLTGAAANWRPTQKPNNSWKNWESGNL